jgi:hypothetical protein
MGLIAVVVIFGFVGWIAHVLERGHAEKDPLFSTDPEVRARLLAEYEERAALATLMPATHRGVAPASPPAAPRRRVTKVEWMLGYRD